MYINSSYKNHSVLDFKDKSKPLIVGSCGTYRLSLQPKLPTYRPRGRVDFQIIYIASGRAYFHFDSPENETIVTAGNIVLFREQKILAAMDGLGVSLISKQNYVYQRRIGL